MKAPVRILITGFGPYPGAPWNPSEWLARMLGKERPPHPGVEVDWLTLPVAWNGAASAAQARFASFRPDAILHFGLAPGTSGFAVETCARNVAIPAPDALGATPAAPWVVAGGPAQLASTLAPSPLEEAIRQQNVSVQLSEDAGGYLCNYVFYRSLHWAAEQERPPLVGFFHIPLFGPGAGAQAAVEGGRAIVNYAAGAAQRLKDRKGN